MLTGQMYILFYELTIHIGCHLFYWALWLFLINLFGYKSFVINVINTFPRSVAYLCIFLILLFDNKQLQILKKIKILVLLFVVKVLSHLCKKSFPFQRYGPKLFSRGFIILPFTFESAVPLELIFCTLSRKGPTLYLSCWRFIMILQSLALCLLSILKNSQPLSLQIVPLSPFLSPFLPGLQMHVIFFMTSLALFFVYFYFTSSCFSCI